MAAASGGTLYTSLPTISDDEDDEAPAHSPIHATSRSPPSSSSSPSFRSRHVVSLVAVLLVCGLILAALPSLLTSVTDADPSLPLSFSPRDAVLSASIPLTPAELEAIELLTGHTDPSPSLPGPLLSLLRVSLYRLAEAVLRLRPTLQRDLWRGDCHVHFPCPFPPSSLRNIATSPVPDEAVLARLLDRPPALAQWAEAWDDPLSPSSLFHSPPSSLSTPSPSSSFPLPPGEPSASLSLALRFQRDLYLLQHPPSCANVSFLVMDYWHTGGGFGSHNHVRSIPLALAFRAGRVLVEAPHVRDAQWAYVMAWNDCVRRQGMGGCGLFLPATSCPLPSDWRRLWEEEKALHPGPPLDPLPSVDAHLAWAAPRRFLPYSELKAGMGDELHHQGAWRGWDAATMAALTADRLAPYRLMPACWWARQALSYHQRMTAEGQARLASLVARSLQLRHPATAAALAVRYADARAAVEETAHWWLIAQALKTAWQLQVIAPALAPALRRRLMSEEGWAAAEAEPEHPFAVVGERVLAGDAGARVPLLGFTFIRHGDKGSEATLLPDAEHLRVMRLVADGWGVRAWYVGADSLTSADAVKAADGNHSRPLLLLSSIAADEVRDRWRHPAVGGFDREKAGLLTDGEREEALWATLVHHAMAQMADVFAASWRSNHVRFGYEVSGTMSEERATAPVYVMDGSEFLSNRCSG